MAFAKFSNPHTNMESYELVSRSEIFVEMDEFRSAEGVSEELEWLQTFLQTSVVVDERGSTVARRQSVVVKDEPLSTGEHAI